jgi:hypothetical protein
MNNWFSEYRVRALAENIAPKIAPKVEAVLLECIRAELPALLMDELRKALPEHTPKHSASMKRQRDGLIRARYNGSNASDLGSQFGLSAKQIARIARGIK